MAGMKKKATPRGGSSKAAAAFAKTTGVGKTAQASRGMNIYAKENIPKGYTVQKVTLSSGKSIAVVGKSKSAATSKPKPKPTPSTWAQRQKKAEADLLKKRKAESKRTGTWPNYGTN
jgi:hypothetical protein